MGLFDDDTDIFGKKKPFSDTDKIGFSDKISDSMTGINKYKSGNTNHGLDIGQQIGADTAKNDIDALFVGKPKNKKKGWF